jgi:hypothetical protein
VTKARKFHTRILQFNLKALADSQTKAPVSFATSRAAVQELKNGFLCDLMLWQFHSNVRNVRISVRTR